MVGWVSLKTVIIMLLLSFLLLSSYFDTYINARRSKHWKEKGVSPSSSKGKTTRYHHHGHHGHSGHQHRQNLGPIASPNLDHTPEKHQPPSYPPFMQPEIFNVLDFGAQGDGDSDDTKAFQETWEEACKLKGSTMVVPSDYTFLVGPISFSGKNCQPNIVFQLDGSIIAPTNAKAWGSSGVRQWLEFRETKGISVCGNGNIDGRGSGWWRRSTMSKLEYDPNTDELQKLPHVKPTAVRFYQSYKAMVSGITIQNSPQFHLKFDNCVGVEVYNITISSPGESTNTDGVHLQNSKDVSVHHSQLGCGDDCISIQTGCSNVNIHHVSCGPGHGISIGGLGRDNTKACVSNITVQNIKFRETMTGVRIKTWQGGSGSVKNVRFSNIQMEQVKIPIIIDQFYCDKRKCKNLTAAVELSDITYENIKGTFTVRPMQFACSDGFPCSEISLDQIQLQPLYRKRYHLRQVFCWQAFGFLRSEIDPPIECLQNGKPMISTIQSDLDSCW